MDPLIRTFLDYLEFEKRYSSHTIRSYGDDLSAFFGFIAQSYGDIPAGEVSSGLIRSWLASLKDLELSSRSINRKISTLKSFYKFQLRTGAIGKSPMAPVISPKISRRLPVYVEQEDTETLFAHMEFGDDWNGMTDRLILGLLYQTGMRLSELVNLRNGQVDFGNRTLKVLGKGNKERIIPVSPALIKEIGEYNAKKPGLAEPVDPVYLLVGKKGKKLYPKYVYLAVKKYLSQVTTIDKKSPHVLRHTFATHLMNGGADLNSVKELLGHASLAATQVYTHNTIEKLKEVHRKAHPKA